MMARYRCAKNVATVATLPAFAASTGRDKMEGLGHRGREDEVELPTDREVKVLVMEGTPVLGLLSLNKQRRSGIKSWREGE